MKKEIRIKTLLMGPGENPGFTTPVEFIQDSDLFALEIPAAQAVVVCPGEELAILELASTGY